MSIIKCPLCGSTDLIWDAQKGMVICGKCGLVIEEGIIDDTGSENLPHKQFSKLKTFKNRFNNYYKINPIRLKIKFVDLNNNLLKILNKDELTDMIFKALLEEASDRTRTRTIFALALYTSLTIKGYGKTKAIEKVSKITNVPPKTITKAIQRYRFLLASIQERVIANWRIEKRKRIRS